MTNLKIKTKKYNSDLEGFECYTNDDRYFQVQFIKETNRLNADYDTFSAELDEINSYDLTENFTSDEIDQLKILIENDKDFSAKANELA